MDLTVVLNLFSNYKRIAQITVHIKQTYIGFFIHIFNK
jgi:hypothetical protein